MLVPSLGLARRIALFPPLSSACVIRELANPRVSARWHGTHAAGVGSADAPHVTAIQPVSTHASFKTPSPPGVPRSFHIYTLLLLRLGLRVQFQHDGPFAIPIVFTFQPVVHGGERHMRL